MGMSRHCFFLRESQIQFLRSLSSQTDIKPSDMLRRMIDHCTQGGVLNEILPFLSGGIRVEKSN